MDRGMTTLRIPLKESGYFELNFPRKISNEDIWYMLDMIYGAFKIWIKIKKRKDPITSIGFYL